MPNEKHLSDAEIVAKVREWLGRSSSRPDQVSMPELRRVCHLAQMYLNDAESESGAMHASASGYQCSDCTIDKEPCPTCYAAWWKSRHPNHQEV